MRKCSIEYSWKGWKKLKLVSCAWCFLVSFWNFHTIDVDTEHGRIFYFGCSHVWEWDWQREKKRRERPHAINSWSFMSFNIVHRIPESDQSLANFECPTNFHDVLQYVLGATNPLGLSNTNDHEIMRASNLIPTQGSTSVYCIAVNCDCCMYSKLHGSVSWCLAYTGGLTCGWQKKAIERKKTKKERKETRHWARECIFELMNSRRSHYTHTPRDLKRDGKRASHATL